MTPFEFNPTFLLLILNGRFYSVPRYQRSYAWTGQMVEEFWTDMLNAIRDNREHFMGTIVLSAETNDGTLSIVDGQQRIVTSTIFLAALRNVFSEHNEATTAAALGTYIAQHDVTVLEDRLRVTMNPYDHPYYSEVIVARQKIAPTRESHQFMAEAYKIFRDALESVVQENPSTWKAEFTKFTTFLAQQARVVVVKAPTDADAFTIFETLNDRGADLGIADLLKNLLLSRAKEQIDVVQLQWLEAVTIIEELKPKTDMMTFLRHFWSSRHGATRERDLYRAIKDTINTKKEAVTFALNLRSDASIYRAILTPSDEHWKDFKDPARSALNIFDRMNLEQIRPMLLAVHRHFPSDEAEKSAKSVLNWAVRGIVAGVIGGGKAEGYFCGAAIKIRDGSIKNTKDLLDELKDFIPNDALFTEALERFRTTQNSFARYMLYAIERRLLGEAEPELVPNQNVEEVNLEHVLPQRAKQADWPQFAPEQVPIYSYRLGNMTLLRKGPNGKIGNKSFTHKQPVLAASDFRLNDSFKTALDWRPEEITARGAALAKIGPSVWPL